MASHKMGHKLFYITNCMQALKRQVAATTGKGTDAAVGERAGWSLRNNSHCSHKPRAMASLAQELPAEETGHELLHERGHRRGALFGGRRGRSPFDLFDSFFPNRNLRLMIDRMDRVFDDPFFARSWMGQGGRSAGESLYRSPWDFVETDNAFRMRLDLPGLSKEEVKVYVEDGSIVIKAEHSEENKADEKQWASRNHATHYSTRILLPDNANAEMIKAELKNGVLSVTVPKVVQEEPKKSVIDVQIH